MRKCAYTVLTDDSCKCVLEGSKVEHFNHKKYSDEDIAKQQFKVAIKRKAVDNVTKKPSKIVSISLGQNNTPRQDVRTRLAETEQLWNEYAAEPRTRERRLKYIKQIGYLNQAKKI